MPETSFVSIVGEGHVRAAGAVLSNPRTAIEAPTRARSSQECA